MAGPPKPISRGGARGTNACSCSSQPCRETVAPCEARGIQCGVDSPSRRNQIFSIFTTCTVSVSSRFNFDKFDLHIRLGRRSVAGRRRRQAHRRRARVTAALHTYAPRMPIPRRRASGAELRGRSVGAGPRSAVHHQRVSLGASRHLHSPVHTAALRPMRRGQAETHSLYMAAERMRSARVHRRASVQAVARTLPPHGGKAHETLASPARSSPGRASPLASFLLA